MKKEKKSLFHAIMWVNNAHIYNKYKRNRVIVWTSNKASDLRYNLKSKHYPQTSQHKMNASVN